MKTDVDRILWAAEKIRMAAEREDDREMIRALAGEIADCADPDLRRELVRRRDAMVEADANADRLARSVVGRGESRDGRAASPPAQAVPAAGAEAMTSQRRAIAMGYLLGKRRAEARARRMLADYVADIQERLTAYDAEVDAELRSLKQEVQLIEAIAERGDHTWLH